MELNAIDASSLKVTHQNGSIVWGTDTQMKTDLDITGTVALKVVSKNRDGKTSTSVIRITAVVPGMQS